MSQHQDVSLNFKRGRTNIENVTVSGIDYFQTICLKLLKYLSFEFLDFFDVFMMIFSLGL